MKIERKYIIAGLIGVVSIAAAAAYLQYKKLMNYTIKVRNVVLKSASINSVNLDLFLNFTNKSSIKFDIISQKYDVYINNILVSKLTGNQNVAVMPKGVSVIPVSVNFNPSSLLEKLGKNAVSLIANFANAVIKIEMKLQVKLYGFTINIPYVYESTIRDLKAQKK
jgi:LEA14-like dessication related protein